MKYFYALILAAFIFAPSVTFAAQLTEPQIQAIIGLLSAFNVPAATISTVNSILHNQPATSQSTAASSTTTNSLFDQKVKVMDIFIVPSYSKLPATVQFSVGYLLPGGEPATVPTHDTASYVLDYGDGSSSPMVYSGLASGDDTNVTTLNWSVPAHVYTKAGTYTARVVRQGVEISEKQFCVATSPYCPNL